MVTYLRAESADEQLLAQLHALVANADHTPLTDALASLVATLAAGREVLCADPDATITPSEAAKYLDVSRPFVYRLLDRGVLPFHAVGRDRRIPTAAVLGYAARREAGRKELAETFASAESDRQALIREMAGLS